jgi:predicted glycoside hydrolase/deacetylase ChbG (UPF0249 family)
MVHPACVDETLYFNSSFNVQRVKEVTLLCDPMFHEILEEQKIERCHFGDFLTLVK